MKISKKNKTIIVRTLSAIAFLLIIFLVWYSRFRKDKTNEIVLKSRYTFQITIDEKGNVLDDVGDQSVNHTSTADQFSDLSINQIADIWIEKFTDQFTQRYLPRTKAIKKVQLDKSKVLDASTNTVLVSFSAKIKDETSEYFSSWDGVMDNGRLKCEWVVTYDVDDHYDGTATIYVQSMVSSEAYGLSQYNESLKSNVGVTKEEESKEESNKLTWYEIKENTLSITYDDGGKYTTVPVDIDYLPLQDNSTNQLKDGSYVISTTKTAFLYGGMTENNKKVPVTLLYSNDKGSNWITCEIDQIYDADYYYVNFFDDNNGVIVVGYAKSNSQESSRIYATTNGGETWNNVGSGPALNVIKGVRYIDSNIGFFCYDYVDGMESNLYMTRDAGKTFSKVTLEPQELDSTAANSSTEATTAAIDTGSGGKTDSNDQGKLQWNDVYKEALVPTYDSDNVLTVYLTQGSNGVYNSGKTAAKYQSQDNGETWKYIGQFEINHK